MHRYVGVWYAYLVGLSVALQAAWPDFEVYLPTVYRHWIIGTATVVYVSDKARQAALVIHSKVGKNERH